MQNSHRTLRHRESSRDYLLFATCFFLLLVGVLIVFGYTPTNDGEGYLEYARTCLAEGQPYPCVKTIVGEPFVWNAGIINLIALSLWAFHSLWPLLLVLCLLKALTAFLVAKIASLLFNHRTGLIALLLFMLYPNNWGQSTMLSSEIPMVFFALLATWMALRNAHWALLAGIVLAVANWFRPVAMVFLGALILYFILSKGKEWFRRSAQLVAGYVLTIVLIGTSCYLRTGYFIYQSDTLWFNMAEATYETDEQPHYNTEMFPRGTARYIDYMEHKTAIECSRIWRQRSLEWLREHPMEYLKKVPARLFYVYKNDIDNLSAFLPDKSNAAENYVTLPLSSLLSKGLVASLSATQWLALFSTLLYILLLLLAVAGTCRLLVHGHGLSTLLLLFIIVGGSLALVLAVHGETRFKAPFMPFFFMLAAICFLKPRE